MYKRNPLEGNLFPHDKPESIRFSRSAWLDWRDWTGFDVITWLASLASEAQSISQRHLVESTWLQYTISPQEWNLQFVQVGEGEEPKEEIHRLQHPTRTMQIPESRVIVESRMNYSSAPRPPSNSRLLSGWCDLEQRYCGSFFTRTLDDNMRKRYTRRDSRYQSETCRQGGMASRHDDIGSALVLIHGFWSIHSG